MLTCIVVDDEQHAIKVMEAHIAATPSLKLLGSFKDSLKAMSWLFANKVDIVFLDVNMPKMNGIELAKAIKGKSKVILCTAYPEYGAVSYEHDVADYLLKPIDYARFLQAVEKTAKLIAAGRAVPQAVQSEFMMLKKGSRLIRIDFEDIIYLSAERNYTKFHFIKYSFTHLVLLKDIIEMLPPMQFVRVHHSYIIAVNKIAQMDKNTILLKNCEIPIPISETYRADLKRILNTKR